MANFFNSFINQIANGDQIKDYQHAARTFIDGMYRLVPKYQSLFHVWIDIDTSIASTTQQELIEVGMLAKSVSLPKFSVQTKTLNAYNRKTIHQEKVNYDPVTIKFHDDSADVVRKFWSNYYRYYYRDGDHQLPMYNQPSKYNSRQAQDWGFSPNSGPQAKNYISSIRIYSLHQKQFSSYILIRPTITAFQHGEHTSGEYNLMEHTMTVAYEAVQYEQGTVRNGQVTGFGQIHYDQNPSPLTTLGGGTRSILGPGGLVQGASDTITNLSNGNYLGAALGGIRTLNNARNTNLKGAAMAELTQTGRNILRGQDQLSPVFVPTRSSVSDSLSRASSTSPGLNILNSRVFGPDNNLPASNQGKSILGLIK